MKITLKAHIAEHREIAKMFVGCKTQSGELLGFHRYYMEGRFATQHNSDFHTMYSDKITIDLSNAKMDLRLAIGTNIHFEGYGRLLSCDNVWGYFSRDFEDNALLRNLKLSADWLNSVGVEAGE